MNSNLLSKSLSYVIFITALLILFTNCQKAETSTNTDATEVASDNPAPTKTKIDANASKPMQAYMKAKNKGIFTYILFYEESIPTCEQMIKNMDEFEKTTHEKVEVIKVNRMNPEYRDIVDELRTLTAPVPLTLLCDKNGAVNAVFTDVAAVEQLNNGFPSPAKSYALQQMVNGKGTIILFYNDTMENVKEIAKICKDAQSKLEGKYQFVEADISNPKEVSFIRELRTEPNYRIPTVIVANASGQITGKYMGTTTVNDLVQAATKKASSGCGPKGCAPGAKGCGVPAAGKKKS